jgi:hypothetical protein
MDRFHETSRRERCPVCGHAGWCIVSNDGGTAICRRVESDKPAQGGGWVHVIKRVKTPAGRVPVPTRKKARAFDAERAHAGFRAEFENGGMMAQCSEDLWLSADAIRRMNVGFSAFYNAWTFPMRDGDGNVVGIRLREVMGSRKWSVPGSNDGLFYDPSLEIGKTESHGLKSRELVVCEGPTDCIAAYEIGLPCVGRSSCMTGAAHLRALCKRLRVQCVTIVTDNDTSKTRLAYSSCGAPMRARSRPGQDGAERLARDLGLNYRLVTPPVKDLRDWVYAGERAVTHDGFVRVAETMPWRLAK